MTTAQISHDSLPIQAARTITFETTEGTFLNLDLSPDGRTLIFDLLGDLYAVPVGGGTATQLTRGLSWDRYPVWSPDGRRIAFISDRTGSDQLWVMRGDGTHRRRVTARQQEALMPPFTTIAWTPDGTSLVSGDSVYDLAGGTRRLPALLTGPVRFSPDGQYVDYVRDGVRRYDRHTGTSVQLAHPPVPTLMRPVVSPDGRWLAYIAGDASNFRDMTRADGLRIRDLETGDDRWLAYPIGQRFRCECLKHQWPLYERYVFTPDSKTILIAYGGKLHRLDVATGRDDTIPFTATVNVELGPFAYHQYRVPSDSLTVRYLRTPDVSPDGRTLVFGALRRLYTMALPRGAPRLLLKTHSQGDAPAQFHPAYSPDGEWIAYVTWSDHGGGHVWRVPAAGGKPERLTSVAAHYRRPEWSPDGKTLAIIASDRSAARGGASNIGSRVGALQLLSSTGGTLRTVTERVSSDAPVTFTPDGQRLLFQSDGSAALVSIRRDGRDRRSLARVVPSRPGTQIVPSPDGRYVAYTIREDVYVAPLPELGDSVVLGDSTDAVAVVRLSRHGGVDPQWEQGGKTLTWIYGDRFYRIDLDSAMAAGREAALTTAEGTQIPLAAPRAVGRGTVVLRGGRVITMRGTEVLENATLVITDGRIAAVGSAGTVRVPPGARVIDVRGRTIMPGLIDLHAHMASPPDVVVANWQFQANLAYGVTTARDPSAYTEQFGYAELIETGQLLGPRLFSVGLSLNPGKVKIESLADARATVQRYKAMGAIVVKQYAQPTRRQRQWILQAAHEAGLNVTNEGASDTSMELTMVLDGYAGVEHNLPEAALFGDVTRLMAEAKTWYTPALQTVYPAYGPLAGREYFLEQGRLDDDPKYQRFTPPEIAHAHRNGYRQVTAADRYFAAVSRSAAEVRHHGGHVTLGSHGADQGIGVHWELWALQMGGLTNHEALQAATILGAEALGVQRDLGSLEVGKIADLLVLDRNPLENIEHSLAIRYVMKNGILYDGATLNTIWPTPRKLPVWMYFQSEVR